MSESQIELLSVPETETDRLRRLLKEAEKGSRIENEDEGGFACLNCWQPTADGTESGYIEHTIECYFRMFNQ